MRNAFRLSILPALRSMSSRIERIFGIRPLRGSPTSYLGHFHGTIQPPARGPVPSSLAAARRERAPGTLASAKTTGFVRIDVAASKKATGSFLFFVNGELLSGEVDGLADAKGEFLEASFRLHAAQQTPASGTAPATRAPMIAVGRLDLESKSRVRQPRAAQPSLSQSMELSIRLA